MVANNQPTPQPSETGCRAAPDFFCIGAQKAGTGWLYEQLRAHPDFWMPPVKELHYFDRLPETGGSAPHRSLPFPRKTEDRMEIARRRARDDRDQRFIEAMKKLCAGSSLDLQSYGELFAQKASLISGDITPGYSVLAD